MKKHLAVMPLALLLASGDAPATPPVGFTVRGSVVVQGNARDQPAWVYLIDEDLRRVPKYGRWLDPVQIVQKDERFIPDVLVVPIGTTVQFPNSDSQVHNVFSPDDKVVGFDLGRYGKDGKKHPWTFDDAVDLPLYCDIHKKMMARLNVVPSKWIERVRDDTTWELHGVPPGHYSVVAWVPWQPHPAIEHIHVDRADVDVTTLHPMPGKPPATHATLNDHVKEIYPN